MTPFGQDALATTIASAGLLAALAAALVLVLIALRRPNDAVLATAAGLIVGCVLVVAVLPIAVPLPVAVALAALATAVAVVGGDPVVRRVLRVAVGDSVREGVRGGIIVSAEDTRGVRAPEEILRGGAVIGYLERLGVVISIVAGYPEAIAVVVAVKGVGRFSELATPAARERFIIGTLGSLLWACLVGAAARLAFA